jgi:WD40 repeat protein
VRAITTGRPVDSVGLSADGRRVMAASRVGLIEVWSARTGERLCFVQSEQLNGGAPACLSADGRLALAGCYDNAVRLWDLDRARCVRTLAGHSERPQAAWLSPDGRVGVSADTDWLLLWDLDEGRCRSRIRHARYRPQAVCLSPDGRLLLSAGQHVLQPVELWDAAAGHRARGLAEHPDTVTTARFSPDSRFVVSGGADGTVRVSDVRSGACAGVLHGHRDKVRDMALTPDGRYALSGSWDGTMRLWELDWELAVP